MSGLRHDHRCPATRHDHGHCAVCRGVACPACDWCPGCGRILCIACNTAPGPALACPDGLTDHPQIEQAPLS